MITKNKEITTINTIQHSHKRPKTQKHLCFFLTEKPIVFEAKLRHSLTLKTISAQQHVYNMLIRQTVQKFISWGFVLHCYRIQVCIYIGFLLVGNNEYLMRILSHVNNDGVPHNKESVACDYTQTHMSVHAKNKK